MQMLCQVILLTISHDCLDLILYNYNRNNKSMHASSFSQCLEHALHSLKNLNLFLKRGQWERCRFPPLALLKNNENLGLCLRLFPLKFSNPLLKNEHILLHFTSALYLL